MKRKHVRTNLLTVLVVFMVILVLIPVQSIGAELQKPSDSNRMKPEDAPTPFSAGQIRAGCPRGRKIVYQVETLGQPVVYQTMTFVTVSEIEGVVESITTGMDGKRIGSKRMTTGKWEDFQSHASFPKKQTEIKKESFTAPAGTFDCWHYKVSLVQDGKNNVQEYWFAIDLPGPPLCFQESTDGKMAFKMVMLKTGK